MAVQSLNGFYIFSREPLICEAIPLEANCTCRILVGVFIADVKAKNGMLCQTEFRIKLFFLPPFSPIRFGFCEGGREGEGTCRYGSPRLNPALRTVPAVGLRTGEGISSMFAVDVFFFLLLLPFLCPPVRVRGGF